MIKREEVNEKYIEKFGEEPDQEEKDYIKIYGWNCVSACSPENKTLINAFLEQNKVDILIINECGAIKEKKVIKNKNYRLLSQGEGEAIIFNEKYTVKQINEHLNDKDTVIAKVYVHIEDQMNIMIY